MSLTPLFDITSFTTLDYPGYLAAIFWFQKCNMKCQYCYNPQIVFGQGRISESEALGFLEKRKGLLDGVVLSGGEATLYPNLHEFVKEIKTKGFLVKLDTNGLRSDIVRDLVESHLVDKISLDYKAPKNKFDQVTKNSHFEDFEETLEYLIHQNISFEVRTTVHVDLINEADIVSMHEYLWQKGYRSTYYLQEFLEATETVGGVASPSRIFDKYLLPKGSSIEWRIRT